ncbi:MAG: serpin family protein [Clostridia bacterium]|nr:serpin family protein [Clostridia bacterium]
MKSDRLQNAIGMVDEDLLPREETTVPAKKKKKALTAIKWTAPIAAVLVFAILITGLFGKDTPMLLTAYAIEAEYPEMAHYPEGEWAPGFDARYDAWSSDKRARRAYYDDINAKNILTFIETTVPAVLSDETNENPVYSPLNVYMALAMLAEITDGEAQNEVLTLLGSKDIESLRKEANALWNANYCDDGAVTSILASSLWMNESVAFKEAPLRVLAENYYASSYQGKMGSEKFNRALQSWLNEQTGGLLKDQIDQIEMPADALMALATTIYFRAKWENEFAEKQTKEAIFHGTDGDTAVDFMNATEYYGAYYWGDSFSATKKSLENSGEMWFILPDEGVSVDALLQDGEAISFLSALDTWENHKSLRVNLSVPKFDVSSDINLKDALQTLDVNACFDPANADFSPLLADDVDAFISEVKHGARVTIDEEGVTAAAYTVMMLCGSAMPPSDEIDFTVDRPFIFAITGESGIPLFIGVVRNIK